MNNLSKLFSGFKKHFVSVFSSNKKNLILGISLGLFLCFFSLQIAHAIYVPIVSEVLELIGYVMSLPVRLPFFFLVLLTAFFSFISAIMFGIVSSFLSMLIEVSLSVPIISGWVVEVGFEFTKNFANMFIILILAFIGLATILKMKEYEARKILPKLIMVALLINFTPVMVGFIVDIANLFTNFFFAEIAKSNAIADLGIFGDFFEEAINDLATIMTIDGEFFDKLLSGSEPIIGTFLSIVIKHVVMILFYTIATLTYLMVSLLFFARFIILWVLVILAPIAFFSQVLPESPTVKALLPSILHWNKWWETLIQWAVIGIPLGFFLYLSNWIIVHSDGMPLSAGALANNIVVGPLTIPIGTIIEQTIGPLVAIFLLIAGIMVSIESMPGLAKGIIKRAKGVGKGVVKRVGGRVAGQAAKRMAGAAKWTRRLDERLGKGSRWKRLGYAVSKPLRWTARATEMAASPALLKYEAKVRAERRPKMPEGMTTAGEKERFIQSQSTSKKRIALSAQMGGQLAETSPEFRQKLTKDAEKHAKDKYHQKDIKDITENLPEIMTVEIAVGLEKEEKKKELQDKIDKKAKEIESSLKPVEIDAEIRAKFNIKEDDEISENQRAEFKASLKDTAAAAISISKARPSSVEKMINPKSLAVRAGSHGWSPKSWQKFIGKFDTDVINDVVEGPGGINSTVTDKSSFKKFCQKNPRLARHLIFNPAGQQMGWSGTQIAEGMSKEKFEKMVKRETAEITAEGAAAGSEEIMGGMTDIPLP